MAQKFVSLEEAAQLIGVTKERLNELREDGRVRAYRDGAGWKFRSEDVDKLIEEGIPGAEPSSSDLSLDIEPEADAAAPSAPPSDIDLEMGGLSLSAGASDLSLEDLDEPTVPVDVAAESDALPLDDGDEESESILLSETELGESTDRPPSTIIGKAEMAADLDLEIASESDAAHKSDVKLAPTASNVFSPPQQESALDVEPPSLSDNFGDVPELEIDLEAESSRILSPEDVSKAKEAAEKAAEVSDLELAASDSNAPAGSSGASVVLDSAAGGDAGGLTGLSALELEGDDDDEVLGEGSDITLSSESSGINIISPSDSGLALDELSGAGSMGSPLDLGSAVDQEISLEPLEVEEGAKAAEGEEPFALTPFAEEAAEEEEDSSQVIPLDEVSEEEAGALLGVAAGPAEGLPDEFATTAFGAAPAAETADVPFPAWIMALLTFNLVALALCGMMMFDMIRNIWSWDGVYTLNSTLLEALNPFLG